jgi:hypothetical protein
MDTLILFGQILSVAYLVVTIPYSTYVWWRRKMHLLLDSFLPTYMFTAAAFLVAAYFT